MTAEQNASGAEIDGRYRYRLWRRTHKGTGTILWVMLNPSTADDLADDPTIRKVMGFSSRWGFDHVRVVNLCALRATNPAELDDTTIDVVGPKNFDVIRSEIAKASKVVVAWGANAETRKAAKDAAARMDAMSFVAKVEMFALGFTKRGSPRHPLMLSYDTPLENWS